MNTPEATPLEEPTQPSIETLTAPSFRKKISPQLILGGCTILALLPFLGKPFHIDDPLFVWIAQQIIQHPFDPFGFSVNWFGTVMPMVEVMRNPPLTSYYLALVGGIAGWSEVAVHTAFLLPAIACVVGVFRLAKKFTQRPLLAGVIVLASPSFLVSATSVMSDVFLLAFLVWAVACWIEGVEERNGRQLLLGLLFMTGAMLTKYSALIFLPLLPLYSILRKRMEWKWIAATAAPLAILFLYLALVNSRYGGDSLFGGLSSAVETAGGYSRIHPLRLLVGCAFLGGAGISAVLAFLPSMKRRELIIGIAIILVVGILSLVVWSEGATIVNFKIPGWSLVQFVLLSFLGICLVAIILYAFLRDADRSKIFFASWIVLGMAFAFFISWSINERYLLPILPAVAITVVRVLDVPGKPGSLRYVLAIVPAAILSLSLAWADMSLAESAKSAAELITKNYRSDGSTTLWFQGHWGFQYYMERGGAQAIDFRSSQVKTGDALVIPINNADIMAPNPQLVQSRQRMEFPVFPWLSTMSPELGAGFYAHVRGPLPFVFGTVPVERYYLFAVGSSQSQ